MLQCPLLSLDHEVLCRFPWLGVALVQALVVVPGFIIAADLSLQGYEPSG